MTMSIQDRQEQNRLMPAVEPKNSSTKPALEIPNPTNAEPTAAAGDTKKAEPEAPTVQETIAP